MPTPKPHAFLCWIVVLLAVSPLTAAPLVRFVAPDGANTNPGTQAKPFATLERARDEIRQLKANGEILKDGANIQLRGGRFFLKQTLIFEARDSGLPGGPITYSAFPGEQPIISGGAVIGHWTKHENRLWVADVPWVREGGAAFTQLFVNGIRRPRARTPNEGAYLYTKRIHYDEQFFKQALGFTYFENDLPPQDELTNAVIVLFHNWVNSYNYIGKLDRDRRRITFARPAGIFFLGAEVRYYIENVFAALDSPGEWFLDTAKGKLFYYPVAGEDMAKMEVIAPRLSGTLINLQGAAGQYVEHLEFRGLSFQHTDANLARDYPHSVQGAHTQRGAVFATWARNVRIADCEFTRLGEHGVSLREGCVSNTVQTCHFHDLGGGGVYLSADTPKSKADEYVSAYNIVDNNFIHDGGYIFRAGCGVFLGGSASYNHITHNEVCDLNWIAIHAGWSWTGKVPTQTHHNEIAWNHLHHLGNGVLNDLGGIYTLGVSPGTVLHHNFIHDTSRFERGRQGYGGWGIYLDAGSSLIRVENNVVCRTRDGGLHVHCDGEPHGDEIVNNVFAYSQDAQMIRNNDKEPGDYHVHLEHNIVFNHTNEMFGGNNWKAGSKFSTDSNCFWSEITAAPDFYKQAFADWQKAGQDVHSIVADPRFMDAAHDDFRLRPDSPALKLGIKSVDLREAGLYGAAAWRALPARVTHRAVERGVPPNDQARREDFEDYEVGETPPEAVAREGGAYAVVTDQHSAKGKRCLKFVDAADAVAWKPHWYLLRLPRNGKVRMACSIRNDPAQPAMFDLEFRDWHGGSQTADSYITGPYLRVLPNGAIQTAATGGKGAPLTLGNVAPGVWARIEIEFEEGDAKPKTWTMRLTPEGGTTTTRAGLPFRSPDFKVCTWFGVAGMDTKPAVFYFDDFRLD